MSAKAAAEQKEWAEQKLPNVLAEAKVHPVWSRLDRIDGANHVTSGRLAAEEELAKLIEAALSKSAL